MASLWERLTGTPPPFTEGKFQKAKKQPIPKLDDATLKKIKSLPAKEREKIQRYYHIFANNPEPDNKYLEDKTVVNYIFYYYYK